MLGLRLRHTVDATLASGREWPVHTRGVVLYVVVGRLQHHVWGETSQSCLSPSSRGHHQLLKVLCYPLLELPVPALQTQR